ncbi:efflux RND transporter periplasmic adaptor subunit [Dongia soli]|uniref:Efflux RND transporter periplasmic adaptor subunit n=1 Tax=Dongia soli TaxID=600628 RepID=A0ABU5EBF9_9PROT|nr:efflux RND transporter periplasmic adaptor subunit [Dongia soli]MDY0883335.1 efflux RND transporter periplasmic adaptor subunit [Dongia soli]
MASAIAKVWCTGVAILLLAGCGEQKPAQQAQAAPPAAVGVQTIIERPVAQGQEFIGRVESISRVDILARVEGFLEAQHFREGQEVKKGDLLFTIEKDMFKAQVDQFEAQVAAAQANLANAEIQYQRDLALVKNQNVPQSTVDKDKAARDAGKAQVLLTQAQLEQAQINLGYTDIYAPVDGKIGATNYDVGNLVSPASKPLVTVVTQDPMYVTFPVAQTELMKIREDRQQEDGTLTKIEFVIRFPDGSTYPHAGRWDFTSPQVDQQTDTVEMRATLPNPERKLIDGQYVKVILRERKPQSRVVVPQAAVQTAQGGSQVLIVDKDNKVAARVVELGQTAGSDYIIVKGLKPGERVIVDGIQKAKPGQIVQPTEVKPQPDFKEQEQGGEPENKTPEDKSQADKTQGDKAKGVGQ